jgi:hypothetical protein
MYNLKKLIKNIIDKIFTQFTNEYPKKSNNKNSMELYINNRNR